MTSLFSIRPSRWLLAGLLLYIALLQWPLWLGKGGWPRVRQLEQQLAEQQLVNQALKIRNDRLEAEVNDLKTGTEAIEEHARNDLGMVKRGEMFYSATNTASATAFAPSRTAANSSSRTQR